MDTASNKPLYDINSLYSKENKVDMLKNYLANKQGMRCINCQNPILQNDLNMYKINYIKPLQYGGYNNIHNLGYLVLHVMRLDLFNYNCVLPFLLLLTYNKYINIRIIANIK